MQINKINQTIPKKLTKVSNNQKDTNRSTSFKGGLDSFCLGVADAIENGGLFVSFTLQDMLGTNLPRPFMGLMRNKKENKGKKNLKFAAKEMVREFTTGPSMFAIPAALLFTGKKIFGKATEIPMKLIKSFGDIHVNALENAGRAVSKQEFFQNAFTEILKNSKGEQQASSGTIEMAADFAKRLLEGASVGKKTLKSTITDMSDDFINAVKGSVQDVAHTDFTRAVISNNTSASFKDTANFLVSYADDVVKKSANKSSSEVVNYVKKLSTNKVIGRLAAIAIMYGAVMTFLQVIPKLYNKAEGKGNAGLKGLMKEETLNDKSLEENKKADKSKPSFGSAASFANKLTGNGLLAKIGSGIEFQGCNVSFPLLLGIMGFGILFPRIRQAKDKYDREEIIRRDVTTCATMCFAEKALRKGFSKFNENKSGLVLASKQTGFKDQSIFKRFFDYIRPIKGVNVLSSEQIVSKYSGIEKYKDGIKGFCEFIEGQGGKLSKVFSLTDESKNIVQGLLSKEGKDIATADNSVIKNVLEKAKDSDELKRLTDLFKEKDNPWVTKAKTLNARFTALSVIVLVPLFLGFLLPWINEKSTKKRIKEEQANMKASETTKLIDASYFNQSQKAKEIFADMQNFAK